jgi:hypothetical protein
MSPPNESERRAPATSNGQGDLATDGQGVLSNLPRTRPQRSSARRTAARAATAAAATTAGARASDPTPAASNGRSAASTPRKGAGSTAKRAPAARSATKTRGAKAGGAKAGRQRAGASRTRAPRPTANAEPAPRQGFECESEHTSRAVHPPGGAELVASVAEILGELTKAGVATGERLLKDALSRLPLS